MNRRGFLAGIGAMLASAAAALGFARVVDGAGAEPDAERLLVQLAGCSVAALGWSQHHPAVPDQYGWSPAYQDVLNLRRRYDAAMQYVEAHEGIRALYAADHKDIAVAQRFVEARERRRSALESLRALPFPGDPIA